MGENKKFDSRTVKPDSYEKTLRAMEELKLEEKELFTTYCYLKGKKAHEVVGELVRKFLREDHTIQKLKELKK